jgi:hypothetical protein
MAHILNAKWGADVAAVVVNTVIDSDERWLCDAVARVVFRAA